MIAMLLQSVQRLFLSLDIFYEDTIYIIVNTCTICILENEKFT